MLRVTVELVPFGNEDAAHTIGQLLIANVTERGDQLATYEFVQLHEADYPYYGNIASFERKLGFWKLIEKIFQRGYRTDIAETHRSLANHATDWNFAGKEQLLNG